MKAINDAVQTNFILDIVDSNKLSVFKSQVQVTTIPAVNMTTTNIAVTPKLISQVAGSALEYDQLFIQFIMDEDYKAYKELYQWMISINNPISGSTIPSGTGTPSIALLHCLNNNRMSNGIVFKFHDVFPASLGPVDFTQLLTDSERIICTTTLGYKYFEMFIDGKPISPFPDPVGSNNGIAKHPGFNSNPNNI